MMRGIRAVALIAVVAALAFLVARTLAAPFNAVETASGRADHNIPGATTGPGKGSLLDSR